MDWKLELVAVPVSDVDRAVPTATGGRYSRFPSVIDSWDVTFGVLVSSLELDDERDEASVNGGPSRDREGPDAPIDLMCSTPWWSSRRPAIA